MLKILFVILWLWFVWLVCTLGEASPDPSEPTVTDRREVKEGRQVLQVFSEIIWEKSQESLSSRVRIGTPLPSEGAGEALVGFFYFLLISL